MNRVLPGEGLPRTLSILDTRVPPSSNRTIDSCDRGVVRDVWSREFRGRTSASAHGGSAEPATGVSKICPKLTPGANPDHPWELGRIDESDPLS